MLAGLSLSSCNKNSVSLNESSKILISGETFVLTATVAPENATNKTLTWTSSNTTIATVSDGTVTALAAGEAVITVKTEDGNKTDSCIVTVEQPRITITVAATASSVCIEGIGGSGTAIVDWDDGSTETLTLNNDLGSDYISHQISHQYASSQNSRIIIISGT